jgi:hypothetical protein
VQEPEKAVDYASQTLNELDKVQSKAILLNDMLNNAREGERIGLEGDAYDQVAAACRGARPKIQRWIEQDSGEREGMMGESSWAEKDAGLQLIRQTDCCCAMTSLTTLWNDSKRARLEIGAKRRRWLNRKFDLWECAPRRALTIAAPIPTRKQPISSLSTPSPMTRDLSLGTAASRFLKLALAALPAP